MVTAVIKRQFTEKNGSKNCSKICLNIYKKHSIHFSMGVNNIGSHGNGLKKVNKLYILATNSH